MDSGPGGLGIYYESNNGYSHCYGTIVLFFGKADASNLRSIPMRDYNYIVVALRYRALNNSPLCRISCTKHFHADRYVAHLKDRLDNLISCVSQIVIC